MRIRGLTTVAALGAAVSLAACANHPPPPPVTAPPPAPVTAPPPPPPPSSASQNQMSHSLVRQVQAMLKQGHMYRGGIDGLYGPMTKRGVMSFQKAHQLPPNGMLDDATLNAMNLQPASGGMSGSGMSNSGMSNSGMSNSGMSNSGMSGSSDSSGSMSNSDNGTMAPPPPVAAPKS